MREWPRMGSGIHPAALAGMTRRRAIGVIAAGAGLPLGIAALRAAAPTGQLFTWQGDVLGAHAEMTLWHADAALARRTILKVRMAIERYERIFSLDRADSEISRLNSAGTLARPSQAMRALIEDSQKMSVLSAGAFDISVQPLWRLHEAHFWSRTNIADDLLGRARDVARTAVDYREIETSAARIAFARPGMAITLNSLAPGFVTDAAVDMLRNEGFVSAVVDLGEVRALGPHPDGRAWRVDIRDALSANGIARAVELQDMALAVSGGYGTTFELTGQFHHIFDPRTGASASTLADAAVIAPRATTANALATAICVAGEDRAADMLAAWPGARAVVTRLDGSRSTIGPIAKGHGMALMRDPTA